MPIAFPLTLPSTPGNRSVRWLDQGNVGMTIAPFSGIQKTYPWPFQLLTAEVTLPSMLEITTGPWIAAFLALNGPAGTFYFGDSVRKLQRGTMSGAVTVAAGAVANSTTLPFTGAGVPAVGDWWQVNTLANSRLHRIVQVNAGSVDVFPVLRSAYAAGTTITYNNAKGVFRLAQRVPWMFDEKKIAQGVSFAIMEDLS